MTRAEWEASVYEAELPDAAEIVAGPCVGNGWTGAIYRTPDLFWLLMISEDRQLRNGPYHWPRGGKMEHTDPSPSLERIMRDVDPPLG